jgi:hypothetical protein
MSRIRTIKPEFFLDDELAELPPLTRLLFIGLWTIADCAGCLHDRPKRIKAQVLPFDNCDPENMLQDLHNAKFILRYRVANEAYIKVVNFNKHQRLSGLEAQSMSHIPQPEKVEEQQKNTEEALEKHSRSDEEAANVQEGKGKERKGIGKEKTIAAPENDLPDEKPAAVAAVRFNAAEFLIEQGADRQTAADYLTLRKGKKAASTHTALRQVANEAEKAGLDMQTALGMCCARGWAGFKAEWVDQQQARAGPQRQTLHEQRKATLDELTGRNRHDQQSQPLDITAEVIRIA